MLNGSLFKSGCGILFAASRRCTYTRPKYIRQVVSGIRCQAKYTCQGVSRIIYRYIEGMVTIQTSVVRFGLILKWYSKLCRGWI